MKRSRFSEEQIIAILKDQAAGMPTADVCRHNRNLSLAAIANRRTANVRFPRFPAKS